MAGTASIEVRELLPAALDDLGEEMRRHFAEQCQAGGRVGWGSLGGKALQAIRDKLSFDVVRAFGDAWAEFRELRDYKDETKHPRDKDERYQLGKNRIELRAEPQLVIRIGALEAPPMAFGYTVTASFEAATLIILNGAIRAAELGGCEVTAVLALGGRPLHEPCALAKGRLPGRVPFDPPIAIP